MELADLRSLCEQFENRVLLFGLKASDELMSAAFAYNQPNGNVCFLLGAPSRS